MGTLLAIIRFLGALFEGLKLWLNYQDGLKNKDALDKEKKRDQASDDQKDAQTEEDFDRAQDKIVDNKP